MKAPLHTLSKADIVKLSAQRCRHRHSYLDHYNCYLKEKNPEERIGFLDIEASHLKANFGVIISWCIKDSSTGKIHEDALTKKDVHSPGLDKRIIISLLDNFITYDRIVTWYGARFDVPYIRSRALTLGLKFPAYGEQFHTDAYDIAKRKLALHSNRLAVVCESLFGETQKTQIKYIHWLRALQGNKKSIDYILDHNRKDVDDLMRIWYKLHDFKRQTKTSI